MADDRCVFPGDAEPPSDPAAGRARRRWLDRATAERLLNGDMSDNAVDPAHRDEAERLARTLNALSALSAEPAPADEELPGEAAALAAFRKARAESADRAAESATTSAESGALAAFRKARGERAERAAGPAASAGSPPASGDDSGLVRLGGRAPAAVRPRWGRPARLGLAAALAVGMVGGVAVAAGTGVLPFGRAEPGPAASVSAAATPDSGRPLVSPTPGARGGGGEETPDGTPSGTPAPNAEGNAKDGTADDDPTSRDGGGWPSGVASACRDVREGKTLDADRRRALEGAAGGSSRVTTYCAKVLDPAGDRFGSGRDERSEGSAGGLSSGPTGGGTGQDGKGENGDEDDKGGKGDKGDKDGEDAVSGGASDGRGTSAGGGSGGGDHRPNGAAAPSSGSSALPKRAAHSTGPSPEPTYSVL